MSKVYFIEAQDKDNLEPNIKKLTRLLEESRVLEAIEKNEYVAIKTHFGEDKNKGYINPQYLGLISRQVRERGGHPFLTDTNTLYKGRRTNAIDHIELALEHGFSWEKTGAALLIADGLHGDCYKEIQVNGEYVDTAFVAQGILEADSIVVVSHFKGHIMSGFGGALKNLGMGCAARKGKLRQHADISPYVIEEKCMACSKCIISCPASAIRLSGGKAAIDQTKCIGCANCIAVCPVSAIEVDYEQGSDFMQYRMAEYAKAALFKKEKKCVFINFAMKITKECDCLAHDDPKICPDIGIFASLDPVSIDKACVDKINALSGKDIFRQMHPRRDWSRQLSHASHIGLGEMRYELIPVII